MLRTLCLTSADIRDIIIKLSDEDKREAKELRKNFQKTLKKCLTNDPICDIIKMFTSQEA